MELQVIDTKQQQNGGMMEVAVSRQAQEVQAAMVIAQRFPRDANRSFTRAIEDCKRKSLAEKAVYRYPRGKDDKGNPLMVVGPSIRLAEALAKAWGNMDFGVIELERKPAMGNVAGESTIMTYAWDLETNTRSQNVFTVKHRRDTKSGGYNLTDERDIYEAVANYAARRKRANILSVIPADFVEKALEQCKSTLANSTEPIVDRIRKMVLAFKELGVSQEMLEKHLGHKLDITTNDEIVALIEIHNSIRDGHADRKDFFDLSSNSTGENQQQQQESEQQTAAEPKTITPKTVKNFAPQSQEEAQAKQSASAQQSNSGPSQQQAQTQEQPQPETQQQSERLKFINQILEVQKELKIKLAEVKFYVAKITGNKETLMKDMTDDQLVSLYQALCGHQESK